MQRTELVAGRYEIEGELAKGGMGAVLLAEDTVLGRKVAVKRLHDHMASDPDMAARFKQEALSAASLTHPGIVTVLDAGEDDGGPFLVMELVEGRTLADRIAEGPVPPEMATVIAADVARALQHAHERGIVHRDVKPGNVMLMDDGRVKIADFGIAKALQGNSTHTTTGKVMGTASYLSPEQVQGKPATPASDVYALGLVLYEMVAGHKAFEGESAVAVAIAQQTQEPPPLPPAVPEDLQAVISRTLQKDPTLRFESAGDLAVALDGIAEGRAPVIAMTAPDVDSTGELPVTEALVAAPAGRRWHGWVLWAIVAMAVVLGLLMVMLTAVGREGSDPRPANDVELSPTRSPSPDDSPVDPGGGVDTDPTEAPTTTAPTTTAPTTTAPTTPPPTTAPPTTPPPTTTAPPPTTAPPTPSPADADGNGTG